MPLLDLSRKVAANWSTADTETKEYCVNIANLIKARHAELVQDEAISSSRPISTQADRNIMGYYQFPVDYHGMTPINEELLTNTSWNNCPLLHPFAEDQSSTPNSRHITMQEYSMPFGAGLFNADRIASFHERCIPPHWHAGGGSRSAGTISITSAMSESSKTLSSESSLPNATKAPPLELTTTAPHENDVLCGRGVVNSHPGNEQYRKFIDLKKQLYLTARFKREKRLISCQIVDQVRNLNPPGRFLMNDPANPCIWHDIGDEKARDKTSQTLREMVLTVRRRLVEDAKLEEDFCKAQQANAALAGVATNKGPPPPPPDLSAGPMGGWRSQPPIQQQQQQTQQQQQSQSPPPPQQKPALQLILEQVAKLEEDIRKKTLVTESILKQWKAQQANAVLSGVATKGPLPPPPKLLSAAPMVSQPVCQPIQQQTQQQLLQQPPLEEFPSIDDFTIFDIMWSSKHQYNQEDDVADPSMEWGLM
jgi:hypothetical protein